MMTALMTIVLVAQSQYWGTDPLPTNLGNVKDMVVAEGRNDGIKRLYVTAGNPAKIFELTKATNGWEAHEIFPGPDVDEVYAIGAGDGRNDGQTKLFIGVHIERDEYWVFEFTWDDGWSPTNMVCRTYDSATTIAIGPGRDDGVNRVYVGSKDGDIWESTFVGPPYSYALIHHFPIVIGKPDGLTVADARNDGTQRLYYCHECFVLEGRYENLSWYFDQVCKNTFGEFTNMAVGQARNDGVLRIYASSWDLAGPNAGYEYTYTGVGVPPWQERGVVPSLLSGDLSCVACSPLRHDGATRVYWSRFGGASSIFESSWQNGQWLNSQFGLVTDPEGFRAMAIGDVNNDGLERICTYCYPPSTNGYEHSYLPEFPSNSKLATAYNEQPHLARMPNTENLFVVYQSSNKVYFSESYDGGVNWNLPQVIGNGIYPAIGVTGFGSPCVTYLSPDGTDLIYKYRDPMMMQWLGFTVFDGNYALIPEQASMFIHSTAGDSVRLAFRVIDLSNEHSFIYYADFPWYETNAVSHSQVIDGQPPDYLDRRSPSISADMLDQLHVAWQKADPMTGLGEIYYRYRDVLGIWSGDYNVKPSPEPSVYPHCEAYGDSVFIHWSEELSSQNLDVWRAARHVFEFPVRWNYTPFPPTPDSSVFPVCAVGEYSVWSEKTNNSNFEIYYWNRTTNQINNLSETPNRSWFGHSNFYQSIMVPPPVLYTCWTESLYADAYEVQVKKLGGGLDFGNDPYVCFYSIPVGDSILSRYTTRRKGRILWPNRGVWADYDSTALSYRLLCPNPKFLYKVVAVPYQEKSGSWSARFTADNLPIRTVSFNSGTWDTFQFWLPENTYKTDKTVNLRIEKSAGEHIPIAYLRVYQFEKKKAATGEGGYAQGGTQSAEIQQVQLKTELKGIAPNPLAKATRIHYTLATASRVSLKVYDPTGRLVRNLVDRTVPPGAHACVWQGSDDRGKRLPNGIYFVRMTTPEYKATEKVILLQK